MTFPTFKTCESVVGGTSGGIEWEFVMPAFGKKIDGPTGRRRNVRQDVVLAASALTIDRSRTVLVEDVSAEGAKLRGRDLPGKGSQILFQLGKWEVFASVVWNGRDECGITFDERLDEERIGRLEREAHWGEVMGIG